MPLRPWLTASVVAGLARRLALPLLVVALLTAAVWVGGPVLHAHWHAHGG